MDKTMIYSHLPVYYQAEKKKNTLITQITTYKKKQKCNALADSDFILTPNETQRALCLWQELSAKLTKQV